jgi:hypothetical protein
MLLRVPRSASVLVNRAATIQCLTETSLQELKRTRPDVAANFYEFLSRYLCERLLNATKSLRILAD